jgi:hypothetical protein
MMGEWRFTYEFVQGLADENILRCVVKERLPRM